MIYITDDKDLEKLKSLEKDKYLYLDTEVVIRDFENIDFFNDRIRLIQIGNEEDIYILDLFKLNKENVITYLKPLIEEKGIIGHNLKFDIKFLKTNLNIFPKIVFDTMIASQILSKGDNGQRHSLALVLKRYTDEEVDKSYQKSVWNIENLSKEQLDYAAKDVQVLRKLFNEEKNLLNSESLLKKAIGDSYKVFGVYNPVSALEMSFLLSLVDIELTGIPIDIDEVQRLKKEKETEFQNDYIKLKSEFNLDPFSPIQVANYLTKKLNIPLPKTEKGSLSSQDIYLKDFTDIEEVGLILNIRTTKKILDKLNEIINFTKDSRVYGEFKQIGASTGRMSSFRPNLQNIPRNLKYIFKTKEGYKFIVADYSQIELRIAAEYTKDENMINAFIEGKDLHKFTASVITGKNYEDISKEERQLAKAINFGLIYGMSPKSLVEYSRLNYGVSISFFDAKKFYDNYFNYFKSFKRWHESIKEFLDKHYYIELSTLFGRKLVAYKFTDAVNYPIQGSGSDLLKMAVALFDRMKTQLDCKVVNLVHDEILVEVKEEDIEKTKEILSQALITAGKFILKHVPVEFEMNISNTWNKD